MLCILCSMTSSFHCISQFKYCTTISKLHKSGNSVPAYFLQSDFTAARAALLSLSPYTSFVHTTTAILSYSVCYVEPDYYKLRCLPLYRLVCLHLIHGKLAQSPVPNSSGVHDADFTLILAQHVASNFSPGEIGILLWTCRFEIP